MYYEISNKVYNHKLTEHERQHNGPFQKMIGRGDKKSPQNFYLTKDTPENLLKVYQAGHCLKPHAFDKTSKPSQMEVNCIVLDFDHLTKAQCEFVKSHSQYGDYSAGMKTNLHLNSGIPGWQPTEWKYKVFHPVSNTLCVYEDIDARFLDAVKHYNPGHADDEVETIWRRWKRANNHKGLNGIGNPIFNGWILPDVAMLNSYRTQITFAAAPAQSEKVKTIDDYWMYSHLPTSGMGKFTSSSIDDYDGLDWKIGEAINTPKERKKDKEHIEGVKQIQNWILNNYAIHERQFNLPLWKADFARRMNKNHFNDLVLAGRELNIMRSKVFAKIHAGHAVCMKLQKDDAKKDARLCANVFARIRQECMGQGMKVDREEALKDIIKAYREIHGVKVFTILKDRKWLNEVTYEMASAYYYSSLNYPSWRLKQRVMMAGLAADDDVIEARNKWRDAIGTPDEDEMRDNFFKVREQFAQARRDEWRDDKWNQPYDYHRKGFKTEIITMLLNGEVKIEDEDGFLDRMRLDICEEDGSFSDELIRNWFKDYRREWNSKYPENPIGRKHHKQHRSDYDEMFRDMTKEEIREWIDNADIHRQTKKRLRNRYL